MQKMMTRRVSDKGVVTIPKDIRWRVLGGSRLVTVEVNNAGQIILTPFDNECILCGSTGEGRRHNGSFLCNNCIDELKG